MDKQQGQKIALAGAVSLVVEPITQMAHLGGPGVIAGFAAGAVAYLIADEVQQAKRQDGGEDTPPPATREKKSTPEHPSLVQRLFVGKSMRSQAGHVQARGEIILSPDVCLSRKHIVGKSVFIVGQRGSGKTTLGARLAEQIGQYNYPMFIPDSEGDLLSIYELLPRGVIAAAPGSRWEDGEEVNLWVVTPSDADVLGFQILYEGMQVILDMSSFVDEDDAWRVVVGVIDGLLEYAKQYPEQLCAVEVFLDEAQKYLPQDLSTSAIKDPDLREELLDAYKDLSGTGGKRGLTPVIMSQRFAETNNKIIAQSEIRCILRQTQDNDLDRCAKYVRANVASKEQIAGFAQGQGVFVGEGGAQILTRFYQRESDGRRSGTPDVNAVDRFKDVPLTLQRPTPAPAPATKRAEPQDSDMKQSKRERIIQKGAQLRFEGLSQAACAEKLNLTAWTIRPYWAEIEAEAEQLRESESQAE